MDERSCASTISHKWHPAFVRTTTVEAPPVSKTEGWHAAKCRLTFRRARLRFSNAYQRTGKHPRKLSSAARMSLISLAVVMLVFSSTPVLAVASSVTTHNQAIWRDSVTSTNWSGYAVTGAKGSVTDVKGSWTVPAIVGACPSASQYSSHWVGIDGYSSNTVEQTGTDSDCQGGVPAYYAWYEFYPHPSFNINGLAIHPGDKITAEVKYANSKFTATITDTTTKKSFSISSKVNSAARSSAEWVTEAPYSGGILPLANFGTISWGSDYTGVSSTNFATVSGKAGAIGSFGSNVHEMTMVTSNGATKASPSSLSTDGTSFTIMWVSAGP
jgi:hypothetical protein